jgi:3-hydroxyisobutyrate dehydrogenase-like beta-hydroxyacid dehydrogenase
MGSVPIFPKVGFVGLGVMGAPMATHLSKAGYALTLYDIDEEALHRLAGAGAIASSLTEVAERSDIVVTMLPNGEVVQQVALGENGLLQGFKPGALLLDTSSSEPWITQKTGLALRERGVSMVDAPVSGAQWGAQSAELVFMVGGAAKDLERVRPLLDRMGRKVFHLGELGAGHAMKCLNNLITAMTLLTTAEGMAIGTRYGLDPALMIDVLNESTGMSWVSQTHFRRRILNRAFDDPFKLELMVKDMAIACELARSTDVPVALSSLGFDLWSAASREAGPGASISELVRWVEKTSGVEIRPRGTSPAAPTGPRPTR